MVKGLEPENSINFGYIDIYGLFKFHAQLSLA